MTTCTLTVPNMAGFAAYIRANAKHARRMVGVGMGTGRTVTICGAGPSLARATIPATDEVWACNSALPYLVDRGDRVTHGFCIDQGEAMLGADEWARTFDVEYLLASTVNPALTRHLRGRRKRWFHSFTGYPNPDGWTGEESEEMTLYRTLYPTSVQVGYGLNSACRALCLALFCGYDHVTLLGVDCACGPAEPMPPYNSRAYGPWLMTLTLYADGRPWSRPREWMAEGVVSGQRWVTRPDMVISAQHIADLVERFPGRVTLDPDTLPAALLRDAEARANMPTIAAPGVLEGFGDSVEQPL